MSSGPRFHLIQAGLQEWNQLWPLTFSWGFLGFQQGSGIFFWYSVSSHLSWAYRGRLGLGMGVATPLPFPP